MANTHQLASLVDVVDARVLGGALNASFANFQIDSRKVQSGDVFVALKAARDGHDYVAAAADKGAVAVLVERQVDVNVPQLIVADVREAMAAYARWWRRQWMGPVIGLTGSVGKTSVKQLCAAIMAQLGSTHATPGNLNNDLGVPMTVLGIQPTHQAAVVEMGANHPGEIALLVSIAEPNVVVITNAGAAHLEGFGSIDGVAHSKAEIYRHGPAAATAIVNADSPYKEKWLADVGSRKVLTFSFAMETADCYASNVVETDAGQRFTLHVQGEQVEIALGLPGQHMVTNAVCAAAACFAAGASLAQVAAGLNDAVATPGRMQVASVAGVKVVDDSYNANPESMKAAIDWLAGQAGTRTLVLGDMAELGDESAQHHAEVGAYAKGKVDQLFTLGVASAATAAAGAGKHFTEFEGLVNELAQTAADVVLVKGSRGAAMERVVAAYVQQLEQEEGS